MSLENIPKDPVMLMSFLNMKLRDHYSSLEAFADDMDINEQELDHNRQTTNRRIHIRQR
jgi:hypothetical protein